MTMSAAAAMLSRRVHALSRSHTSRVNDPAFERHFQISALMFTHKTNLNVVNMIFLIVYI